MFTRRSICCGLSSLAAASLVRPAVAGECDALTPEAQQALTPASALERLQQGNARFVAGEMLNCNLMDQVHATAMGQYPAAAIVGCIDSRVPPEMVFDQGIGDIFAARIAGNFIDNNIIGSLEFTTAAAGAKLIVVLGHSACGAVRGAIDGVQLGSLTGMLNNIMPAVAEVLPEGGGSSSDAALVQSVAEANVRIGVANLTRDSVVLRGLVANGDLMIVGAMHDISTGVVTFM